MNQMPLIIAIATGGNVRKEPWANDWTLLREFMWLVLWVS